MNFLLGSLGEDYLYLIQRKIVQSDWLVGCSSAKWKRVSIGATRSYAHLESENSPYK